MIKSLTKTFSFFMKEFHDVRRQPRLMLSLVGGPLLVLAAFGATFRSANPFISTVLVWPADGVPGVSQEQAAKFIDSNFYLVEVTSDREKAMGMLEDGSVDVVQIIPEFNLDAAAGGERPEIEVISRTIDPNAEAWIRSLAYGEMNFINRQLLSLEAQQAQDKAREISARLEVAQAEFEQIGLSLDQEKIERVQELIAELRPVLVGLIGVLPPESLAQANLSPELSKLHQDVNILIDDLEELESTLQQGEALTQVERLSSSTEEIKIL